jgi:predicted nuclease of predicted toxin-antitoxin system
LAEPIRYFMDEHYPAPVTQGLRRLGIDVLTAQDAGRTGLPDPDQLAFATAENRVLVTFDSDYLALHHSGIDHAGIAWCREQKYAVGMLIQLLQLLHGVSDRDQMRNRVEYL